jgi:putative phage-type endonuclease
MQNEINIEQVGNAELVADFEPGSDEWLAIRRTGVSGSDVAAIVGVSKWSSALAVWAKKLGKIDDHVEKNEPMEWGTILEPVVRDYFSAFTGWPVIEVGTYRNIERPWQIANPDGLIVKDDGKLALLEVKTARFEDDWIIPTLGEFGSAAGVPRYYRTQVQHYLDTLSIDEAYVAVLFGGQRFRVYHVPADPFEQEYNRERCEEFMTCLTTETKPEWDGSNATYETARALNPDIDSGAKVDLGDLGIHLANAASDLADADAKLTELKSRTIDALGKAQIGYVDIDGQEIVVAQRSSRAGGTPYLTIKTKGANK